jgi:glucosamine-6-phosphate deaminase
MYLVSKFQEGHTKETNVKMKRFKIGTLKLEVHKNGQAAGEAAAKAAAQKLNQLSRLQATIGVIFATGASQLDTLQALTGIADLPWSQIKGFHLDDYIGIPANHPASFRRYLRENLTRKVKMKDFFEIDGTAPDLQQVCRDYTENIRSSNPKLCLLGVGENGHLAFNDPAEARFDDPLDMKVVHLDTLCREQQFAEGWFKSSDEVPKVAMTLTIPTLFRVPTLIGSVPGSRKAKIMRRTLEGPISTDCPASILRTHPDTTIYLDTESAAELDGLMEFDEAE